MKKLITWTLIMTICLSSLCGCSDSNISSIDNQPPAYEKKTEYKDTSVDEFVLCSENSHLKLFVKPSTTEFAVENLQDGSLWYSSPQDIDEDEFATKLTQMQMRSTLVVEYVNIENQKSSELSLYTSCVRSKKYQISLIENGVLFTYDVKDIGRYLYFAITLDTDSLKTDVWFETYDENKTNIYVNSVSVLPYFVRGKLGEEGYLFLPDGSGATVSFNTDKKAASSYSRPIYGEEPTQITADYYLAAGKQSVALPVLGAKNSNGAIMAIAEKSAETGIIKAFSCGQKSSYANAFVSFKQLSSVEYEVGSYTTVLFDKKSTDQTVSLRYYFLSGDDANYSGMARKYREYLKEKYTLEDNFYKTAFYSDVYGGVYKRISTLGIPNDKFVPLTTAEQVEIMTDWLTKNGVSDINIRYRSWNIDELKGNRVDGVKIHSSLNIKKLINISNATVYPSFNTIQTYSNGGFFDSLVNASYSISGLPFTMKGYNTSNLQETKEKTYWISSDKLSTNVTKLFKSAEKKEFIKLAFDDIGNSLYCDFKADDSRRNVAKLIASEKLRKANEQFESIMLDAPNAYAAIYADVIYNVPVSHSNQDILEKSVPFYSMVMSGFSDCVAPSFNGENADDKLELFIAMSGCYPCFTWIGEETSVLVNTSLSHLSNVNFDTTKDVALDCYSRFKPLYDMVTDSRLYSHEYLNEDISVTQYENGVKVYVNFSDKKIDVDENIQIDGNSFIVIGG